MRRALPVAVVAFLVLAACTSDDDGSPPPIDRAAPAPCRTDVLANWQAEGVAVLFAPWHVDVQSRDETAAAVIGVNVANGDVMSYCELPGVTELGAYTLPMRQGGVAYPAYRIDTDLMLRTQWLAPDFTWFGAPGAPLVDVASGRAVEDPGGTVVGVGDDLALIRDGDRWCTRRLPLESGRDCETIDPPDGAGAFVIGADGQPVWVTAEAVPLPFGSVSAFAITDGHRVYAVDTLPAATRVRDGPRPPDPAPVDLDPSGLGGHQAAIDEQPAHDLTGWFSVESVAPGGVRTRYHRTTAQPVDRVFSLFDVAEDVSRAVVDGGAGSVTAWSAPVSGSPAPGRSNSETRFAALSDGSPDVVDLTEERGLRCPVDGALCRILAWPDDSFTPGGDTDP